VGQRLEPGSCRGGVPVVELDQSLFRDGNVQKDYGLRQGFGMSDLTVTSLTPPVAPPVPEVVVPARPRWVFWLGAALVTLLGAVLRLVGLDRPPELVFDEAFHAVQGRELFRHGVEWDPDRGTAISVADPPLGRWLIGVGEHLFGYNAFGWRIGAATVGTLSILLFVLIAFRLFGSGLLACAAGLLMAMDGLHFVLSRTAMLDIFAMFFVLAGFGCVVLNRERPPGRTVPWWLLGAGLCFGLACGVKLSVVVRREVARSE
jgi:dolichyl-phosphate-mannose-protein mannosyltransferase